MESRYRTFKDFYPFYLSEHGNRNSRPCEGGTSHDEGSIPKLHTCQGKDVSPPLAWSGVPENVKSLVLIVDDPDAPDPAAPRMTWVHWVLYNIPPSSMGLPQGVSATELHEGTLEGMSDFQRTGYGGPCPPIGRHRYFQKLYALDTALPNLNKPQRPMSRRQ